ncbi:MAG TPA: AAA domain-containing protein, partial [Longimicrobium sp.]|nr:AAA domain-containing protein [Longimicrobium sp.]
EGDGEAAFVRGLLDGEVPGGWLRPLDAAAGWAETVGRAGRPVLNREQEEAWRAAFERAVTVIWGPPGTGKTYLLAWTLLGLAAAAKREGRPFRVLVTAVTHRAIVNVLSRLAREVEASGIPAPLRAVKLKGRGAAPDVELAGGMVEVIEDEKLTAYLEAADAEGMPLLVGSTVWSLWKRMRAANGGDDTKPVHPMFDVVVIDEASQMKVAESLVALSSARRGARVILAGDDRQLAPIVRGSYPEDDPLFGSTFSYHSERFGRVMLRESRRMSEGLIDYPRRLFYPGLVAWEPEREIRTLPEVDLSDPLDALLWDVFFRPEHAAVLVTYDGYHATARNPLEASLAARLASLARAGLADPETGARYAAEKFRSHALAILSPHRAQNSAILGELAARGWPREEMPVVDTVERMQGNEREMVIVSYAVADREYAEREAEFLLDPNRFNVSITRARSKLVVFVSEEILRALPRDERVMTASMAVKGYPRALAAGTREIEVPAPDGTLVRLVCRFR